MSNPSEAFVSILPFPQPQPSRSLGLCVFLVANCLVCTPVQAATNTPAAVLTQHNDNARTGMNLNETTLNINNVNTTQFGLLFTRAVDDQIYAPPLLLTNVNLPGKGTHNLLISATVNNTVYAYDPHD